MTPERFISVIRARLPKRFHEEVIRENIGIAYSDFLSQQPDLTQHRKDYFEVDVTIADNYSYSLLPISVVNIPDAIRVDNLSGKDYIFEEIEDGESQIMNELEVSKVSNVIGFIKRGDRILYYNLDPVITKVDMRLVVPFQNLDYEEEFYLPAGAGELILETVGNFLGVTPARLDLNDGSEITA